jgi:hypothetical protein
MNDTPPPLAPPSSPSPLSPEPYRVHPEASASGSGGKWLFGCGCGCLVALLLFAIGSYFAYTKVREVAADLVAEYSANEPVPVEITPLSDSQIDQSLAKFSAFEAGMDGSADPVPLVLTGQDINALIQAHPSFEALAGRASVTVEGNTLRSRLSLNLGELDIPIPFLAEAVEGRYFNGVATFSLGMAVGRPALYIERLEVNGAEIPAEIMGEISKQNLLEELVKEPQFAAMVEKIEDIRIAKDELTIVPKGLP